MEDFPHLTVEHEVLKRRVQFKFNADRCRQAGLQETPSADKYEVVKLRRVYHFNKNTSDHVVLTIPQPVFVLVDKNSEEGSMLHRKQNPSPKKGKNKKRKHVESFCDSSGDEMVIERCSTIERTESPNHTNKIISNTRNHLFSSNASSLRSTLRDNPKNVSPQQMHAGSDVPTTTAMKVSSSPIKVAANLVQEPPNSEESLDSGVFDEFTVNEEIINEGSIFRTPSTTVEEIRENAHNPTMLDDQISLNEESQENSVHQNIVLRVPPQPSILCRDSDTGEDNEITKIQAKLIIQEHSYVKSINSDDKEPIAEINSFITACKRFCQPTGTSDDSLKQTSPKVEETVTDACISHKLEENTLMLDDITSQKDVNAIENTVNFVENNIRDYIEEASDFIWPPTRNSMENEDPVQAIIPAQESFFQDCLEIETKHSIKHLEDIPIANRYQVPQDCFSANVCNSLEQSILGGSIAKENSSPEQVLKNGPISTPPLQDVSVVKTSPCLVQDFRPKTPPTLKEASIIKVCSLFPESDLVSKDDLIQILSEICQKRFISTTSIQQSIHNNLILLLKLPNDCETIKEEAYALEQTVQHSVISKDCIAEPITKEPRTFQECSVPNVPLHLKQHIDSDLIKTQADAAQPNFISQLSEYRQESASVQKFNENCALEKTHIEKREVSNQNLINRCSGSENLVQDLQNNIDGVSTELQIRNQSVELSLISKPVASLQNSFTETTVQCLQKSAEIATRDTKSPRSESSKDVAEIASQFLHVGCSGTNINVFQVCDISNQNKDFVINNKTSKLFGNTSQEIARQKPPILGVKLAVIESFYMSPNKPEIDYSQKEASIAEKFNAESNSHETEKCTVSLKSFDVVSEIRINEPGQDIGTITDVTKIFNGLQIRTTASCAECNEHDVLFVKQLESKGMDEISQTRDAQDVELDPLLRRSIFTPSARRRETNNLNGDCLKTDSSKLEKKEKRKIIGDNAEILMEEIYNAPDPNIKEQINFNDSHSTIYNVQNNVGEIQESCKETLVKEVPKIHNGSQRLNLAESEPIIKKPRLVLRNRHCRGFSREERNKTPKLLSQYDYIISTLERDISIPVNTTSKNQSRRDKEIKYYRCDMCNYKSTVEKNIKLHRRTHLKPFSCSLCTKTFVRIQDLEYHVGDSHDVVKVTVNSTKNNDGRTVEKDDQDGEKPIYKLNVRAYKCGFCTYQSSYIRRLQHHALIHKREKLYSCEICEFTTLSKWLWNYHNNRHTEPNSPYECEECGFITISKVQLQEHMQLHSVQKVHKCDKCQFSTGQLDYFVVHLSFHLPKPEAAALDDDAVMKEQGKLYTCYECGYNTLLYSTLFKHALKAHKKTVSIRVLLKSNSEPAHMCTKCGFTADSSEAIDEHSVIHLDVKPNKCEHCDYITYNKRNFRQHMIRHATLTCEYCHKKHTNVGSLEAHIKKWHPTIEVT